MFLISEVLQSKAGSNIQLMLYSYASSSKVQAAPQPSGPSNLNSHSQTNASGSFEDLLKIFNTALVATKSSNPRNFAAELQEVLKSPAFRMILATVRQYAKNQAIEDRQAAEQIIQAFRKIDQLWTEYLFQEGVERIKENT